MCQSKKNETAKKIVRGGFFGVAPSTPNSSGGKRLTSNEDIWPGISARRKVLKNAAWNGRRNDHYLAGVVGWVQPTYHPLGT